LGPYARRIYDKKGPRTAFYKETMKAGKERDGETTLNRRKQRERRGHSPQSNGGTEEEKRKGEAEDRKWRLTGCLFSRKVKSRNI